MLALLPHVTLCNPWLPLVTVVIFVPLGYPLLPLVTRVTPFYPLLPLVTLVTSCYPLLPLLHFNAIVKKSVLFALGEKYKTALIY